MKNLLTVGLLVSSIGLGGCAALNPQKMCEDQLADARAQLTQTAALATRLSAQLKEQQAEIEAVRQLSAEDVRRERAKSLAEIEAQREDLERERFEINRMRQIEEAHADD
jgi:hypothetical protein